MSRQYRRCESNTVGRPNDSIQPRRGPHKHRETHRLRAEGVGLQCRVGRGRILLGILLRKIPSQLYRIWLAFFWCRAATMVQIELIIVIAWEDMQVIVPNILI